MKKFAAFLFLQCLLNANISAQNFDCAKSWDARTIEGSHSISIDNVGNVVTIGGFYGTVDFDPGIDTFNLTAPTAGIGFFISKFNSQGVFIWAKSIDSLPWYGSFQVLCTNDKRKFPRRGSFKLPPDGSLRATVVEHDVLNEFGVYLVSLVSGSRLDLVYIGKAGTVKASGNWKEQGIAKRLANRQRKESRTFFFRRLIAERELDGLHFEWFVTFNSGTRVLPILAEAELLQAYFNEHGRLPELNACA